MIAVSQTKSANYLFIVAVLKSMREGGGLSPCIPLTKATPICEVSQGSSPHVSIPLPQRGSRKIFILGDQNVSPVYWVRFSIDCAALNLARASSDVATARR